MTQAHVERVTLETFLEAHPVLFRAVRLNGHTREGWPMDARHWRVTLRTDRGRLVTVFTQGSAHTKAPTVVDVLDCIASDAAGYENARDFGDWASEYGYDEDSRKAERTYRQVERQAELLREMFDEDDYQTLLFNTERQ